MRREIVGLMLLGVCLNCKVVVAKDADIKQVSPESSSVRVVGSCRFRIKDMLGGRYSGYGKGGLYVLPLTGKASFNRGGFGMSCIDVSEERIATYLNGKHLDGKWWRLGSYQNPDIEPYEKAANASTVKLHGRNWSGVAYAVDDTTGEERKRARTLNFCLIHGLHALCGDVVVQWLSAQKKRNDLPRIKAILESVEFVDPVDLPTPGIDDAPAMVTEGR